MCDPPELPLIATIPVRSWTFLGTLCWIVVPSPTCPRSLRPQAHTVPFAFSATLWEVLALTATTFCSFAVWTGVVRRFVVRSPSWP